MSQDPYLPLFVGDFLASTATWTGPERGLYVQLLAFQWASGPLPCDLDRLALALHYEPKEFHRLWPVVGKKFKNGDGALTNIRLESVRVKSAEVQASRIAKATAASNARWNASSNAQASTEQSIEQCPGMPSNPIQSNPIQSNPKPRAGGRAKRAPSGHRLPEDWIFSPERQKVAEAEKIDGVREFQKFTNHFRAESGAKGRKRDWEAAWRNWCMRAADYAPAGRKVVRIPKTVEELEAEEAARAHQ